MALSALEAFQRQRVALATITPSGNTVVERVSIELLRSVPEASAHFSRVPVFGDRDPSPGAYAIEPFLAAAELLAHAKPKVLLWNGSKGLGLGFEHDRALAARLTDATGIAATTSTLGLEAVLRERGITRVAVVSPHVEAYQTKLLASLAKEGLDCIAEAHADVADNLSYASLPMDSIAAMVRSVAVQRPQAILTVCTNFPAAPLVASLEAELGLPIFDTVALGLWQALRVAGLDPREAAAWGRLFAE